LFYGIVDRLLVDAPLAGDLASCPSLFTPLRVLKVVKTLFEREAVGFVEVLDCCQMASSCGLMGGLAVYGRTLGRRLNCTISSDVELG
jgi:hypothetical protein